MQQLQCFGLKKRRKRNLVCFFLFCLFLVLSLLFNPVPQNRPYGESRDDALGTLLCGCGGGCAWREKLGDGAGDTAGEACV